MFKRKSASPSLCSEKTILVCDLVVAMTTVAAVHWLVLPREMGVDVYGCKSSVVLEKKTEPGMCSRRCQLLTSCLGGVSPLSPMIICLVVQNLQLSSDEDSASVSDVRKEHPNKDISLSGQNIFLSRQLLWSSLFTTSGKKPCFALIFRFLKKMIGNKGFWLSQCLLVPGLFRLKFSSLILFKAL